MQRDKNKLHRNVLANRVGVAFLEDITTFSLSLSLSYLIIEEQGLGCYVHYFGIMYDRYFSPSSYAFGREEYVTRIGYTVINVRVIANIPIRRDPL